MCSAIYTLRAQIVMLSRGMEATWTSDATRTLLASCDQREWRLVEQAEGDLKYYY